MSNDKSKPEGFDTLQVTDPHGAPFVFFEGAPISGYGGDMITITLANGRHTRQGEAVVNTVTAVAHLRCSVYGAQELLTSLQNALNTAEQARRPH